MKQLSIWTIGISLLIGCASGLTNISWDLKPAGRPGYGYTAEDPILIGFSGDIGKNIDLSDVYLAGLRTKDDQPLHVTMRFAVKDPNHEPEYPEVLGVPMRNGSPKGGILDLYELVSTSGSDTVRLYIDIYHKDSLRVPAGLHFVPPAPSR